MAWYRAGAATFTNGSKNVTGSGTAWASNVRPGDEIIGPDNISREVETVTSDTALTMVETYAGSTASGASYKVKPIQGWTRDVAAQLAALVNDYGSIEAALAVVSGNVGIGTNSPARKLEVSGASTFLRVSGTGGTPAAVELSSGGAVNWSLRSNNAATSEFSVYQDSTERFRVDSAGRFLIGRTVSNASAPKLSIEGRIDSVATGVSAFSFGVNSAAQSFVINDTSSGSEVERMRVDSSGRAGIGMASAGQRLSLKAGGVSYSNGALALVDSASGSTTYLTHVAGDFYVSNNGSTDHIRLKSSGYLGVGGDPVRPIHIYESSNGAVSRFQSSFANGGYAEFFDGASILLYLGYGSALSATAANTDAVIRYLNNLIVSNSGTERMRIDSSGNVGIGTTTPGAKLHVNGSVRMDVSVTASNAGAGGAQALPSAPAGYAIISIGGVDRKIPYYP